MIKIGNEKTDYGNWVPAAMMNTCYVACVILALAEIVCIALKVNGIATVLLGVAFVEILKKEGITEIHYIGNIDKTDMVPKFVTAPWMISGVGMIYGKK